MPPRAVASSSASWLDHAGRRAKSMTAPGQQVAPVSRPHGITGSALFALRGAFVPTPIADLVRQLGTSGCSIEQIAMAVGSLENQIQAADQQRRQTNAERQARWRDRNVTKRYVTPRHVMSRDPSPADTTPPLSSKSKKISRSAVEIPETPSDKNIEDATSRGWSTDYAKSEWQRFKDWSANKGRKHRNVDAAWRNWVTSPYQKNGSGNGGNRLPDGIT